MGNLFKALQLIRKERKVCFPEDISSISDFLSIYINNQTTKADIKAEKSWCVQQLEIYPENQDGFMGGK